MRKRIAIITGASGGIGKEFTKQIIHEDVDEIWAIARNQSKLDILKEEAGSKIVTVSRDLSNPEELRSIGTLLEEQQPEVAYLINNAGIARMDSYGGFASEEIETAVYLNCSVAVILCTLCIPYMKKGSRILNISSAASFQPLPYLNLYAATKAFERFYSRALHMELQNTGITVTAVCPGWVDTELLMKECGGKAVKFPGLVLPEQVAIKALKDAGKGKDISVYSLYVKYLHLLAKLFPQKMMMKIWLYRIRGINFAGQMHK